MKLNNKGTHRAKQLLKDIGYDEITNVPMDMLVSGLGATLIETPLNNSDGKIIRGKSKTLIKINSNIPYPKKRRFTIAHEIGHLILHEKLEIHNENTNTLNWFKNTEDQAKKGIQEWEANDFASELLMPEYLFRDFCYKKPFNPQLIQALSDRFKTSITSTLFRIQRLNIYPVTIVFIHNGIVKYWLKSTDTRYFIKNITNLAPPQDSVAQEYLDADYNFVYTGEEKTQNIFKSTWFELKNDESDSGFYEYCIPTKQYKNIISVIWEE